MNIVYIGLGSNIEPRKDYLERAIQLLDNNDAITVQKQSSIYETAPVGYQEQRHFLNMVVELATTLSQLDLLAYCQGIEKELGRNREGKTIKNGPRTIDLDILLFNNENRELDILRIPHPRLQDRAFVLVPLSEIAPKKVHPLSGFTMEELLARLPRKELKGVVKWDGK